MSSTRFSSVFLWVEKKSGKAVAIISGVAFLIRFLPSFFLNPFHWPDAVAYHNLALSILKEGVYLDTYWAPSYPYFLANVYSLFGINIPIVIFFQSIFGSISCVFLFIIGRHVFNNRAGIISALLLAVYPFHVILSSLLLTETLFIFLLLIWIYLLIKLSKNYCLSGILSGVILGILVLTRPISLILFPVSLFFLLVQQNRELKKKLFFWIFMMVFCLFVLSPWALKNYTERGVVILSSTAGARNFWMGNNPLAGATDTEYTKASIEKKKELLERYGVDPVQLFIHGDEGLYYKAAFNWIKENPSKFVLNYVKKFFNFWRLTPDQVTHVKGFLLIKAGSIILLLTLYLSCIWGIILSRPYCRRLSLLYLIIGAFPLGLSFFITSFRFRMVVDPLLILFSAYFLHCALNKVKVFKCTE